MIQEMLEDANHVRRWKRHRRNRMIVLLAVVVVVACVCVYHVAKVVRVFRSGQVEVTSFKIGGDRRMNLYAESSWEVTQPFFYEVVQDGRVVVPRYIFFYRAPKQKTWNFSLVRAGRIVGVVDTARPKQLMIIHDLDDSESWPYRGNEAWEGNWAKGQRLLEEFNRSDSTGGYVLYDG